MPKTPGKVHMYDMVKIDIIVFEIVGGAFFFYAVTIIQMTLKLAWIYEIHYFELKVVSIYRKEVKIIAINYFLTTLPILATKIAITRYLVIVSTWD